VGNPLHDGQPSRRGEPGGEAEEGRLLECQRPGFWDDVEWLPCRDGKYRPVEPGLMPVADGVPERVGRIRGFGNAIVPQVGARFIRAFLGSAGDCN
jgi:DNA (cytosine-5)-methyltransferase 1